MLYGLSIILIALITGEMLHQFCHLAIPSVVIGMLLLTGWFIFRRSVEPRVAQTADGILRYFGLLFVPAGVGVLELGARLQINGTAMFITIVISTAVTLTVTGLVLNFLIERRKKPHAKDVV